MEQTKNPQTANFGLSAISEITNSGQRKCDLLATNPAQTKSQQSLKNSNLICKRCEETRTYKCSFTHPAKPGEFIHVYTDCACHDIDFAQEVFEDSIQALKKYSNVPDSMIDVRLVNLKKDEHNALAIQASKSFLTHFKLASKWIFITGKPGTGKTTLAVAIANELMSTKLVNVLFYDASEFINACLDAGKFSDKTSPMPSAKSAQLLIIDDIISDGRGDIVKSKWFELINYRLTHKLPIIFTSNSNSQMDIELMLGKRIADRLNGNCYFTEIHGESRR